MPDALVRIVYQDAGAEAGINRVSAALGRLERGEPTRALRQTRLAVDELAVAASGLNPAIGRLASTFAMFGIGGATGIAAVGGLAAIGLEVKSLLNIVPQLEERFKKLNTEFAQMGGPGAIGRAKIQDIRERLEEVSEPGFFEKLLGGMARFSPVAGAIGSAALAGPLAGEQIGRATEAATFHNELLRIHGEVMKLHADAMKKHADELRLEREKAQHFTLGMGNVTPGMQAFGLTSIAAGATYGRAPQIDWMGRPIIGESNLTDLGRVGVLGAGGGLVGTSRSGVTPGGDRRNIELAVGAAMSIISGLAQGGGPGPAIGGLGSAATALSGLKGISTGAAGILGPLGIGLSAVSSVFSLFSSGQAKVTITRIEDEALANIRDVLQLPQNVSAVFVGSGDPRQLRQDLDRLAAKTGVVTLPGRP